MTRHPDLKVPVLRRLREHPGDEPADKFAFARKIFAAAVPSAL